MNKIVSAKNKNQVTLYPQMKEGLWRNYAFKEAVVITSSDKTANILHRGYREGNWNLVQLKLNKEQLQDYINELQSACDKLSD